MSRVSDTKPFKKAMLLICEGSRTEPNFFGALFEDKTRFRFDGEIEILPKPSLENEDVETHTARGGRERPLKRLKGEVPAVKGAFFPGPQPLNWVLAGIKNLDTYEEVWCIFDKDDHPKRADAFALAAQERIKGAPLFIAFSSRCIEYYFILHNEYLYHAFEKSECNEKVNGKSRVFRCMLPDAVVGKACDGYRCTNGYARMKDYWKDSKSDPLYPRLKDHLLFAVRNAEMVRRDSDSKNPTIPFYDRNPYVNVDYLIARLLGLTLMTKGYSTIVSKGGTELELKRTINNDIIIGNTGSIAFSLRSLCIEQLDPYTETLLKSIQGSSILFPGQSEVFTLKGNDGDLFRICLDSFIFLVVY